jgi:ATP-binding cassette subfamily C protein LapB
MVASSGQPRRTQRTLQRASLFARPRHELKTCAAVGATGVLRGFATPGSCLPAAPAMRFFASFPINLVSPMRRCSSCKITTAGVQSGHRQPQGLSIGLLIGNRFRTESCEWCAHLLDKGHKKPDVILSATLFERITGMSMKARTSKPSAVLPRKHSRLRARANFLTAGGYPDQLDRPALRGADAGGDRSASAAGWW